MGQTVEIRDVDEIGDVLLIDTDRSLTGQDGYAITPAQPGRAVPGELAKRLFELGIGIDHVYVLQNTVSVRRPGGWDEATTSQVTDVTSHFLRHYEAEKEDEKEDESEDE
ncbi:MAG: hypothetical protein DWQ20_02925 [Actinobacteria bacterium]|nr:MAG: hypothetical protein DWQ20_02925 [Actinomycetota bacterium]